MHILDPAALFYWLMVKIYFNLRKIYSSDSFLWNKSDIQWSLHEHLKPVFLGLEDFSLTPMHLHILYTHGDMKISDVKIQQQSIFKAQSMFTSTSLLCLCWEEPIWKRHAYMWNDFPLFLLMTRVCLQDVSPLCTSHSPLRGKEQQKRREDLHTPVHECWSETGMQ